MTIATTRSHQFNVGQICRLGYRMAGLLSVYQDMTAQQAQAAIDFLEVIVHASETEGMFARNVEFETITLAEDDDDYELSASTLDVTGTAMYVPPGQTLVEIPVLPMGRESWQTKGVRDAGGPPSQYYAHRTADTITLYLWPVPGASEDGGTVRLQSHRLRADVTDSNVTPDFEGYWVDYLAKRLAMELAGSNSLGLDKVGDLERKAAIALAKCRGKSNQGRTQQFVLQHRIGR